MTRIAIIGAGISGLVVARALAKRHDVNVFEKSRGCGGRIATRYANEWQFDHGAQFFTARSSSFQNFLKPMVDARVIASWNASFVEIAADRIVTRRGWDDSHPHYVAVPGMNALGKYLADGLDVRTNTQIAELRRENKVWTIVDSSGSECGDFDWVISSAPAEQTSALLPAESSLQLHAGQAKLLGCFALMLGFDDPLPLEWQAAIVGEADISWVSVNSSKPGRDAPYSLVVHSTNQWAEKHFADEPGIVKARMLDSASAAIDMDARLASHQAVHRWRYANIDKQSVVSQVDAKNRLAACGDWFVRGRVEGAFTSANRLIAELGQLI